MEPSGRTVAAEGLRALVHREYTPAAQLLQYPFPCCRLHKRKVMHVWRKGGELRVALVEFKAMTLSANMHLHFKSWQNG